MLTRHAPVAAVHVIHGHGEITERRNALLAHRRKEANKRRALGRFPHVSDADEQGDGPPRGSRHLDQENAGIEPAGAENRHGRRDVTHDPALIMP
jgi:hypothetical protein